MPTIAWFVASGSMGLKRITALEITLLAIFVSVAMLKVVSNYLQDGFIRSYMDSDNWDYLSARFGVARIPTEFVNSPRTQGLGQLDRDDVVFAMDTIVSETGLYVNLLPFGRLTMPWTSVQMLSRRRLMTESGPQQSVAVTLDGPDCALCIPWTDELDSAVPASVGLG